MANANIILTYRCVNNCPYCFSSKTHDKSDNSILSRNEFLFYLNLLKRSGQHDVRLLGGEPFLHPQIGEFIHLIMDDDWFEHLTIFTTGFVDPKFYEELKDRRVNLVVNVNHSDDYTKDKYSFLIQILKRLSELPVEIVLGMNFYKENLDYFHVLALAKQLGCKRFRWTIAVPSSNATTVFLDRYQRKRIAPQLLDFLQSCKEAYLIPVMDCPIEPCMFTDEQLGRFARLCPDAVPKIGKCSPVIDLGPDYKVIRCFASDGICDQDAREFDTLEDIEGYFKKTIEVHRIYAVSEECQNCSFLQSGLCKGGCISGNSQYINDIIAKQKEIPEILSECKNLYMTGGYTEALSKLHSGLNGVVLPEILIEYANALLLSNNRKQFSELMEKEKGRLISSGIKSADLLIARYYLVKGDSIGALGFLRRCLLNVKENRKENIKSMIKRIESSIDEN